MGEEGAGIGDAPGIDAVGAEADGSELFVADGDGIRGAPLLTDLEAGGKEVDVRFEGGFKALVLVVEVSEKGQITGGKGVEAGAKDVSDLSLIDEEA